MQKVNMQIKTIVTDLVSPSVVSASAIHCEKGCAILGKGDCKIQLHMYADPALTNEERHRIAAKKLADILQLPGRWDGECNHLTSRCEWAPYEAPDVLSFDMDESKKQPGPVAFGNGHGFLEGMRVHWFRDDTAPGTGVITKVDGNVCTIAIDPHEEHVTYVHVGYLTPGFPPKV